MNGITVGNCLNTSDFLVQPSIAVLTGMSPVGRRLHAHPLQGRRDREGGGAKKNPKTTALVENGVVDFKGNPSTYAGAPPAKISKVELAAIKRCIDKAK